MRMVGYLLRVVKKITVRFTRLFLVLSSLKILDVTMLCLRRQPALFLPKKPSKINFVKSVTYLFDDP